LFTTLVPEWTLNKNKPKTPGASHLFNTNTDSKNLTEKQVKVFNYLVANLLYKWQYHFYVQE